MLVSPTEPPRLKSLGTVSSVPERHGSDFLIVAKGIRFGVQRKKFPDDLLSSLADGRLYTQVHAMQDLDHRMLIVEGYGRWTVDGELIDFRSFRREQMYALFWTIAYEFDFEVIRVSDMNETALVLRTLDAWAQKAEHKSLKARPGMKGKKDTWGRKREDEKERFARHLLMSWDGIGPGMADEIVKHFGRVPLSWDVGEKELMKVKGIGKVTARKMIGMLGNNDKT